MSFAKIFFCMFLNKNSYFSWLNDRGNNMLRLMFVQIESDAHEVKVMEVNSGSEP